MPGEVKEVLLNNQKAVEITEKEIILKPYQLSFWRPLSNAASEQQRKNNSYLADSLLK